MATKLVILDMAGTTVADDDAVAIAFQKAFAAHGYEIAVDDVRPLMGYKKVYAVKRVLELSDIEADEHLVGKIHDQFVAEMIEHYKTSPTVMPAPGAEELLAWLKDKEIRVAMNTGFPKSIADVIMNRFQWVDRNLVDDYIASDEVELGRPHPFMIGKLMENGGIENPQEVVKVGDTEVDINEGRNAGCGMVIGITSGAFTRDELNQYHPDYVIDNLDELKTLIG